MFLGPTGVGKTELAKSLAESLFDDERAITRIDMSEYMEQHAVSRLIGSPPGYIGYEQGGQLTEAVRRRPYSIVLFDEVEKAHQDVFNVLLQVLDDGRLTDGQGRTVNFSNTVIIMTSNIGSSFIQDWDGQNFDKLENTLHGELNRHFRPEFINRIDDIVIFDMLDRDSIRKIVEIQMEEVRGRLELRSINLKWNVAVLDYLAKNGYDSHYGARPIKRIIQNKILNQIAQLIINQSVNDGDTVSVSVKNEQFTFDIKSGKKVSSFGEKEIGEVKAAV